MNKHKPQRLFSDCIWIVANYSAPQFLLTQFHYEDNVTMALTTDGKTLSPAFQSIYERGAADLTTDEEKSKWALFLSFYDTLQQKPENKSEALAFAAAKLAERYTAGETDFYGVDLSMMIRELGQLSVAVTTASEDELKQAGA
jgi:hypothetical protein